MADVPRTTYAREEDFYITPYLTCKECSTCSFVKDKPLQRRILQMKSPGLSALFQDMPPCPGCGASHAYVLGVFDFSEEIRESLDNLHTSRCERSSAATMLQTYLRMCY